MHIVDHLGFRLFIASACIVVSAAAASPGQHHRTPAEIERRRADIAARLAVLAEEEMLLARMLIDVQQATAPRDAADGPVLDLAPTDIAVRLDSIVAEREILGVEAQELSTVVTRTATGPVARADPQGLSAAQIGGGAAQVSAGTAFNPAITVIPDGLYYYDNAGGAGARRFAGAEGFEPAGADDDAEDIARGFSLREVEVAFSGAVDPYFDVWAVFGIGDGAIEAEEVYVQTRRFLPGTQVRFGRFFSGIGYMNRQHRHQWDFVDQALAYDVLFGPKIDEVGVQVTWLPAIPIYTQFGFEALQGDNRLIANQLADEYPEQLDDTPGPRLFTGFIKVSPDLGFSHTLQGGVSAGRSRSHQEADANARRTNVFDGSSWFAGTDWIWRYDSARPYGERDLSVQGEYIYRAKTLEPASPSAGRASGSQQDGLYAQIVYGIAPRWTVGARFDAIGLRNQVEAPAGTVDFEATTRYTGNATFNPTEFSRLRVQYNYGRVPNDPTRIHQVFVQLQVSLGVHGAHIF